MARRRRRASRVRLALKPREYPAVTHTLIHNCGKCYNLFIFSILYNIYTKHDSWNEGWSTPLDIPRRFALACVTF